MRQLDEEVLENYEAKLKEMNSKITDKFHELIDNFEDPFPATHEIVLGKKWFSPVAENLEGLRYYIWGQKFDIVWKQDHEVEIRKKIL